MATGTEVRNFAIGAAILVVLAGVVFVIRKRGDIVAAVNPLDERNLINRAVSGAVQAVTGDKDATLGTKLFDLVQRAKEAIGVPAKVAEGVPVPRGVKCFAPPCPSGTFLLTRTNPTTGALEGYNVGTGKWERLLRTQMLGLPSKPAQEQTVDFT